jgi:hypothetical protein
MDPYLEGELWTSFHHELAVAIKYQLSPKLEPRYVAMTARYMLLDSGQEEVEIRENIYPDVGIAKASSLPMPHAETASMPTLVEPLIMATPMPRLVPQYRIVIRDVKERKLVTILEFLSPANKRGKGRRQYLRKRNRILRSTTHLVEIDLQRKGQRAPLSTKYPEGSYFVLVSRANKRPRADVYPIALAHSLPSVPIPLLRKDADVRLDLQAAVTSVYDLGRFKYLIDYRGVPDSALSAQENSWVDGLLRTKGMP